MKVDVYMKVVLTGILGCLVWLCVALTPVGMPVQAQLGPTQVVIAGFQAGGAVQPVENGLPMFVVGEGSRKYSTTAPATAPAAMAAPLVSTPQTPRSQPAQVGGRCQAITKKGTQCLRNAKPGSSYCWQHGG